MSEQATSPATPGDVSRRRVLLPLALTQFVASFAGSSMLSEDLDTTVHANPVPKG